jgi:hypothetical protein
MFSWSNTKQWRCSKTGKRGQEPNGHLRRAGIGFHLWLPTLSGKLGLQSQESILCKSKLKHEQSCSFVTRKKAQVTHTSGA